MFNDTIVVQSALSAFNNAALAAPAFLWNAILTIPLFAIVWFYGNTFLGTIGWAGNNISKRLSLTVVILIMMWVVLLGGNYNVLRDSASVLPFVSAAILFLGSYFVGAHTRNLALPRRSRIWHTLAIITVVAIIAMFDMHAWWGPVLQLGAVLFGGFLARAYQITPSVRWWPVGMIVLATTAILMQPEFFRFGQLGNLGIAHMGAIAAVIATAAMAFATGIVNPRARIYHRAYIKLKWLLRIVAILAVVLFILTESVPVFFGLGAIIFVLCALSVWHTQVQSPDTCDAMIAATMIAFGVVSGVHVITAVGIVKLRILHAIPGWRDIRTLL